MSGLHDCMHWAKNPMLFHQPCFMQETGLGLRNKYVTTYQAHAWGVLIMAVQGTAPSM